VVEIHEECVLPEEEIGAAWRALRNGWGAGADRLPAGGRLRLTLRLDAERRVVLVVSGGDPSWKPDRLLARVPALAAVVHRSGDKDEQAADPAAVDVSLGFEQVNDGAAALLRAHVLAEATDVRRAVDAYCGAGPYGRALAEQGVSVVGIELDPEAAAEAVRGAPEGFEVRTGSVEELLPTALPTELLIVNPPRTGLGPDVVAAITADPPERLIYVSCDPATLARDLAGLASRYEIGGVRCFDLFPQTAHIETVVRLNLSSER
jgi:23S rRNA (uracil1939-C5)-methyltransferase